MEKFPYTKTTMTAPAKIFDYVHIAMMIPAAVVAVSPETPVLSVVYDQVLSIVLLN